MAGYRLTFDGSLNERKDVAQAIGNSSLSQQIVYTPSRWDNIVDLSNTMKGDFDQQPNTYLEGWYNGSSPGTINHAGGNAEIIPLNISNSHYFFMTPQYAGGFSGTIEVRVKARNNGFPWVNMFINISGINGDRSLNSSGGTAISGSVNVANAWTTYSYPFTIVGTTRYIRVGFVSNVLANKGYDVDYIKIYQSGGVSIAPSTFIAGVAPTGGVAETASPSTIVDGQSAIAGAPKLFGAKIVHAASEVFSAKYLPPATVSQDAEAKVSKEKYITATATSISVEAEGLGGADKLGAGRTSIVVENVPGTVEN